MANEADVTFARDMIPHHESAVEMGLAVIAGGEDPEINMMARAIVEGQSAEIGRLKAWLAQNDGSAPRKPTARPDWAMAGMG